MRNILLKTLVLALVANLAYAEPSSSATEEANTNKTNVSKPVDGRIFMGFGIGARLGRSFETSSGKSYHNIGAFEFVLGWEMIFDKGHGFNIYGSIDNLGAIAVNYVYESTSSIKWAVLTGFDTGLGLLHETYLDRHYNYYGFRYNLGVRFRKNRHAISLIAKIPLFENTITRETYYGDKENIKMYAGVNTLVRYTYFFGL